MKLLWFTWKDLKNPLAGGAEVVNEELAKRLVADGHEVTLLVGGFKGAAATEVHADGYTIIRIGNRFSVYLMAWRYYRQQLRGWADLVIDEVNTVPFFAKFYVREPNIMFVHMLCRRIWFYQLPWPINVVGYLLEPLYMRLLRDRKAITISASTANDLRRVGFSPEQIAIISEGIELSPLSVLPASAKDRPLELLSLGSIRPMKRTLDQVRAFNLARRSLPNLKLALAGDANGAYGKRVLKAIEDSPYSADITYHGRVSKADKQRLLERADVLLVTSVKEGWGLVVTEANSQGTPAIAYDVDGLRDSVRHRQTGWLTTVNPPTVLAHAIMDAFMNMQDYHRVRQAAHEWSQSITFDQSYQDFKQALNL